MFELVPGLLIYLRRSFLQKINSLSIINIKIVHPNFAETWNYQPTFL